MSARISSAADGVSQCLAAEWAGGRIPISLDPLVEGGPRRKGWAQGAVVTNAIAKSATGTDTFPDFLFSHNLAVTIALVGGVIDRDIAGITGLLATDKIIELQPLADLPSTIGIAGQRIIANGTLRIRYITPIAIVLSSTTINYRLTVKRALA